ncbi:MAG TPA: acetylpolyamine amidohydrolase [Spirochaetota bacterium]|nr:acetylpolyamine amidohydrolase [Spirochaetota bacterium]
MIRIRRLFNPYIPHNIDAFNAVKNIIKEQFPLLAIKKIDEIEDQLINPLKYKYHTSLFIAEDIHDSIKGVALVLHFTDLGIFYLDYLAVKPGKSSGGIGSALYQRIRKEASLLNVFGIFLECLPDDPLLCNNPEDVEQNKKRLAFYERFGARPIINTLYESKVKPDDDCPPYLVFDGLGNYDSIPNKLARNIIQAILERKYNDYCDEKYITRVIESIKDDPVQLRPFRYIHNKTLIHNIVTPHTYTIRLYINDRHHIHHVKDRGYVESPVRVKSILSELLKSDIFENGKISHYPDKFIYEVHNKNYVDYFKNVCKNLPEGKSVYPYVFPIRNAARAPRELSVRAGYYCFDTFTPLNKNAYLAARWGVNCVLSAVDDIVSGIPVAYVLTRPPGHHAEHSVFGGFCYFNNVAIAAQRFSKVGKVAILEIDYHHGNGQQQIFYKRNDVLTISIHGHPSFAYPYFSGFAEELGEENGKGFNYNFPLPETISYDKYKHTLLRAVKIIKDFNPDFLIVALGLDVGKGDPTGTWGLVKEDFYTNGGIIATCGIPTLIVQEGGYRNLTIGKNAFAFFMGFYNSFTLKK